MINIAICHALGELFHLHDSERSISTLSSWYVSPVAPVIQNIFQNVSLRAHYYLEGQQMR